MAKIKKRKFVIGDIHGGYLALKQLINKLEIREDDQFIFLGDYVDGWSQSATVIDFLMQFAQQNHCIFIKGNHDQWCEDWLRTGAQNLHWEVNGGRSTQLSYQSLSNQEKALHLAFFEGMKLYFIDAENRLYVHAGFSSMHGVDKEINPLNLMWDRTLWELAVAMKNSLKKTDLAYPPRLKHYSEIYIGHTPTLRYEEELPMKRGNVWNIDTGAGFTGSLSMMEVVSKEVYQSDRLVNLYPLENGRNG